MTLVTGASHGPAQQIQERNAIAAKIPFVLPQVLFQGGRTIVKMGQGALAKVAFVSASTDVTVAHNFGHPVLLAWGAMAPAGTFIPQVMISATSNPSPNKNVILQASAIANPVTVVLF